MNIRVLLFATLKQRAGRAELTLELPEGAAVRAARTALVEQIPTLDAGIVERALAAVNQEFAADEDVLSEGAELAFFPPVSGGASSYPTYVKITHDPLDLDELTELITQETTGAICVFSGIVRGKTARGEGHDTAFLEYEAYAPMAEAKMAQVAEEIRVRWPSVEGIVVVQRIGRLDPGTPTVLIACAAAHRDTGVFEAARYGIDRLKEIVPVWKKEVGPQGEAWVEGDYFPKPGE